MFSISNALSTQYLAVGRNTAENSGVGTPKGRLKLFIAFSYSNVEWLQTVMLLQLFIILQITLDFLFVFLAFLLAFAHNIMSSVVV